KITTGGYGDSRFDDEFTWAAAELLISTGNAAYAEEITVLPADSMEVPSWPQVRLLGYYSLMSHQEKVADLLGDKLDNIKSEFRLFIDNLNSGTDGHIYQTVMGKQREDFVWG